MHRLGSSFVSVARAAQERLPAIAAGRTHYLQKTSPNHFPPLRRGVSSASDKGCFHAGEAMPKLAPSLDFFREINERNPAFNFSAVIATEPPSEYVIQRAREIKAEGPGDNIYTDGDGLPLLKEAIVKYFKSSGVSVEGKNNIVIKGSLFNIIQDVLRVLPKGDVLLPSPTFGYYAILAQQSDHKPRTIDGDKEKDYKISPEKLRKALDTTQAKCVILNNPVNPTGQFYTQEELLELAEVIKDFPEVIVLSDEIFKDMPLDGNQEITSIGAIKEIEDQVITLSGVGKSRGLIAQRVSFAHIPDKLSDRLSSSCLTGDISRYAQIQAAVSLEDVPENSKYLEKSRFEHQYKINFVKQKIKDINQRLSEHFQDGDHTEYVKLTLEPKAANMLLLSFKGLKGTVIEKEGIKKKILSGLDMAHYLLDSADVALSPGESFFMEPSEMALRLPIGYSQKQLKDGLNNIETALSKLEAPDKKLIETARLTIDLNSPAALLQDY